MLAFITCGGVSRIPRTSNGENENDTGHSWSLEALAIEYLTKLYPEEGLDKSLVRAFSHVHDLVEIETQDVNTFSLTAEQLAKKQEAERQALEEILKELPSEMSRLLEQYERQDTREALFVRAVDKILPTLISCVAGEQGVRVIEEACKVTCIEDLRAAHDHRLQMFKENFGKYFPELVDQYKYVLVRFELEYLRIKQMDNAPASSSSPEQSTQPKEEVSRRYCIDPEKLPLGDLMKEVSERRHRPRIPRS